MGEGGRWEERRILQLHLRAAIAKASWVGSRTGISSCGDSYAEVPSEVKARLVGLDSWRWRYKWEWNAKRAV